MLQLIAGGIGLLLLIWIGVALMPKPPYIVPAAAGMDRELRTYAGCSATLMLGALAVGGLLLKVLGVW